MDKREKVQQLASDLSSGRIDRRDFVRQALGLGLSLATVGSLLSACGGGKKKDKPDGKKPDKPIDTKPADTKPADTKPTSESKPAEPPKVELEKELVIYNWSDYIADNTVANFEKEFNVKVTYGIYESNEDLLAKLQTGAAGYDLVCPSGYAGQVMIALGIAEKLTMAQIPNITNVAAQFRKTTFDPTDEYTVPWQWGRTGIAFRKDLVKAVPDSWAVFHDAQYANKMTQMDDVRDVIGAWLKFRGKSVNSVNPDELNQAKTDALTAKKLLQKYVSADVKGSLISGDVVVAQLWDGDTYQAQAENPEVDWILPKEGGSIWLDSMMIPKGALHPKAAHAFLNYILRPDVGAAISDKTGYGSPNKAAQLKKPVPFPSDEQMKLLEFQIDLGKDTELWDRIWTELKAG